MSGQQGRQAAQAEMSSVVLDHIEKHGSFHRFQAPGQERLALMKVAVGQGLIVWNKVVGKYELTTVGHKRLAEYRHKIATAVWYGW
jgi:hypothetical protein